MPSPVHPEYQCITEDGANVQISTVQWDVKDGERFDIGFTDEAGHKVPCPVIVHASSFGSIERTLCAILENIAVDSAAGMPPMFPFWLAPTQVRIVPVSDAFVDAALEVCAALTAHRVRVDVDDRTETVGNTEGQFCCWQARSKQGQGWSKVLQSFDYRDTELKVDFLSLVSIKCQPQLRRL